MVQRISKAILPLVLSLLTALPVAATDRGSHIGLHRHGIERPHIGGVTGMRTVARRHWDIRLADRDGFRFHRHRHGRFTYLRQLATSDNFLSTRSGRRIILVDRSYGDLGDSYSGSIYAYNADGGTYVIGDGYGGYPVQEVRRLAPRAKIIDTSKNRDGCSYEQGVCVIRP